MLLLDWNGIAYVNLIDHCGAINEEQTLVNRLIIYIMYYGWKLSGILANHCSRLRVGSDLITPVLVVRDVTLGFTLTLTFLSFYEISRHGDYVCLFFSFTSASGHPPLGT